MDGKETCGKAGPDRRRDKPIAAPTAGWWWSGSIAPCSRLQPRYLPQSPMGQAISYALNQWATLQRFLDHGEVEIDNNLVENAIRPTAIGKKNWLFFGSEEAGQRSAVIYTLIENCRMHGVEPYTYLKDVLERLPTMTNQQVARLTPLNWKKEHPSPSQNGRLILTRRQANRSSYHNPPTSTGGRSFTAYHCGGSKSSFTMR